MPSWSISASSPAWLEDGEAEHGDDRGDADRDPERRERGAQAACAHADARDPGEVGGPQPRGCEVRAAGMLLGAVGDGAHRALTGTGRELR